jgi:uncharacterized surface protein with fasciclin (FAS1) repeats
MNSITRIISHALVASLMVFLAACSESGDGVLYEDDLPTAEAPAAPTPDPGPGNIVEVATESGSFPTLLAAVEAAGLVDALSDSSASLTVFAPTEAAFAALPEGTLDSLLADPDALANVLTYHVLGSSVDASAALGLAPTTVGTLNGAKVAVTTRNDENLYVNYSKVVDYDIEASNGVIHVVDSVLLPPDLTPSALTIAEIASADENFSTLVAALTAANLVGAVSDPDAALTVFAPTNAAFDALGEGAVPFLLNNLELLEQILLYHVLGAEVTSIDAIVAAGSDVTMLNGEDATISLSEGGQGLMINGSNIVVTDIVAANGIIHVIDAVLGTDDLELGEEDTGILGTWQLAPEAGSLGVGPAEFDVSWWNGDDGVIALRDCLYDDEFVFSRDGSFKNVLGDTTWVEGWQGGADSCAAPVAPHDGSNQATFEYDEEAMTLTLTGQGAYMGIPKPVNGAELASPAAAPEIVIYNAYAQEDGSLVLSIEAGAGVWWNYKLVKTAEPPPPSPFPGTWVVASEAGSLGVGPAEFDVSWWNGDAGVLEARACYYDDEYIFTPDGGFRVDTQGETWVEAWQGAAEDSCAAPVSPHDGSIEATWSHDQVAGKLTINGKGSYVGLPKAVNGAELANPADTPDNIVYNVYPQEDGSVLVSVEAGAGVWWNYKLVKTAEAAEPSVLAGTWYMSLADASLGVGPNEFDVSWWANDAAVTDGRACYFDDSYVFGAYGSFANVQDGETWVEAWQGVGEDQCAAPVAPHDGSANASYSYDAEAQTITVNGLGAYIGLPKAINGAEIAATADAASSITYNAYLNDDGTMGVTVEAGAGVWWNYVLTRD